MVLIVSFSSRISPFTSTVIFRERSPRATAVVTAAMLRTCAVRFRAIALTESVRSLHGRARAGPGAWTTKPAFAADFARHARDFGRERTQLLNHRVQRLFQLQH